MSAEHHVKYLCLRFFGWTTWPNFIESFYQSSMGNLVNIGLECQSGPPPYTCIMHRASICFPQCVEARFKGIFLGVVAPKLCKAPGIVRISNLLYIFCAHSSVSDLNFYFNDMCVCHCVIVNKRSGSLGSVISILLMCFITALSSCDRK